MKPKTLSTSKPILYKPRFRSRLEERIADQLEAEGIAFKYESEKIKYLVPARNSTYLLDFDVGPFLIEAKGYFRSASERQKYVLLKEQHPDRDIRLVFQNANNPIYKGSKTTYGQWATDHGFKWADGGKIPEDWLEEIVTEAKAAEAFPHKGKHQPA